MKNNDLISRTALLEIIGSMSTAWEYGQAVTDIYKIIKNQPAVDAVPVVHGRWIYKERHRKSYRQYTGYDAVGDIHTVTVIEETGGKEPYCSECGAQAAESYMDFCPHCGAKMDGGANDAEQ